MSDVAALIERAAARTGGNKSALARALKVPQQRIHHWSSGERTCTADDRALLAAAAGEDPLQEMARAMIEKHADTPRGELFRKVLGKPLHQTGAATVTALLSLVSLTFGLIEALHTMYKPPPQRIRFGHC